MIMLSIITYTLIIQGSGGLIRLYTLDQIHIEKALLEVDLGLNRSPVIIYFRWLLEIAMESMGVIDDRVSGEMGLYRASISYYQLNRSLSLLCAFVFFL